MTEPRHPVRQQPQHCWVDVTGTFGGDHTYAGVLLEWRKSPTPPHRWEGLVAYAVGDAHGWQMVTRWMLAEHLKGAQPGRRI